MQIHNIITKKAFLVPASIAALVTGLFVVWELGFLADYMYSPPRPEPTLIEYMFAILLVSLISINAGLLRWQQKFGSCPMGTKRASSIAGILGISALVCPACVLIPFTIFGTSIALSAFSAYIPLLQIVSIFLLIVSMIQLWPKKQAHAIGK